MTEWYNFFFNLQVFFLRSDQHLSRGTRDFFLFISSLERLDQQSSRNVGRTFFRKRIELFVFSGRKAPFWNISFLSLSLESSISRNVRFFFRVGFFIFRGPKVPSWNIRKFHFQKYKKSFFFRAGFLRENYKKFL